MNNAEHPSIEQLTDYVHGELSEPDDAAIHAHLAGCAPCSELHESEARLGELLRQHASAQERELPPGFADRIVEAARASEARAGLDLREAFAWLLRPAVAMPAAAAIALGIYLGSATFHPQVRNATIDAASYFESHASLATDMPFADSTVVPIALAAQSGAVVSNGP